MNRPNPAIVTQLAVQRLPRVALVLFCVAYVLPGWFGREPWKSAEMAAFGYMHAMASGATSWFHPLVAGLSPEHPGLLPLWLGAGSILAFGGALGPEFASRIPFGLMLGASMAFCWYATYFLARRDAAQPVTLAFGGHAEPADYARAVADGALLALIACLGLAQLSHQATIDVAQLCAATALFWALAALPRTPLAGVAVFGAGAALAASGAPTVALLVLACGGFAVYRVLAEAHAEHRAQATEHARLQLAEPLQAPPVSQIALLGVLLASAAAAAVLGLLLEQFRWSFRLPSAALQVRDLLRLWVWFAWPSALLAIWTLWRWRGQWLAPHLSLPLAFGAVALGASAFTPNADRSALLALPAVSALAAFALPTVRRSVAALVDWFTLLFFSACATVIWVVWFAMHTGWPVQTAANVVKLAPGFEPQFSMPAALIAMLATGAWIGLVRWRVGRFRHPMWKSLVLPAGGAALCWTLLMTLWLPLLDFARSYAPLMRSVSATLKVPGCVYAVGLTRAQLAALSWYTKRPVGTSEAADCPYLVVDADAYKADIAATLGPNWAALATHRRPADKDENLIVFVRTP